MRGIFHRTLPAPFSIGPQRAQNLAMEDDAFGLQIAQNGSDTVS